MTSTLTCNAIIVCCSDFRVQKFIRQFTDEKLAGKTFDMVGYAGSTKDLDIILKQIDISIKHHGIKQVILIHHEECDIYGIESNLEHHISDLNRAKTMILKTHPDLKIDLYYLTLDGEFQVINTL